jgi:lipopolysaccharide assembly outer membrane protein LptD (OstA)
MRKRVIAIAGGVALCIGALAVAQAPQLSVQADNFVREVSGQTTLTGGVSIMVDGVLVRADKAVVKGREVSLEGNVRMTLPSRFSVSSKF